MVFYCTNGGFKDLQTEKMDGKKEWSHRTSVGQAEL